MHSNVKAFLFPLIGASCACTPLKRFWSAESASSQSAQQTEVPTPTVPVTQPRPLVSNALAYARFAALNLKEHTSNQLTPAQVEEAFLHGAEVSDVPFEKVIQLLALENPNSPSADKSTSTKRAEEFRFQHQNCTALGYSAQGCCRAMAWPIAVLPRVSSISEQSRQEILRLVSDSNRSKREVLVSLIHLQQGSPLAASFSQANQGESSEADEPQSDPNAESLSYRLSGLKAWLGVCHAALSSAPATLSDFYRAHAPDFSDDSRWQKALHAKSRAKRGPRRVYMRRDGLLSVAETLNEECFVSETEVILRRPDGALNYWVYDATGRLTPESHFPAPSRDGRFVTVLKLAPDSCMGCHYDFVTRQFDQLKVSADHLRLPKTAELPVRCAAPDEKIAQDN